ncbi:MAG: 16S rRNA (cytidine(1402)-2'-O)-methyltransferase [Gorillibacterium sp.]|nr:16S rRNA (cytidine(1402)-2'-O)-methyltransferase [Gorillibacterium sp.]
MNLWAHLKSKRGQGRGRTYLNVTVQKSFRDTTGTGTLYLVGTPIGNLEDMTFRAVRILKEADIIAAEDTRQTRKLLTHYEISGKLVSYHEHNKEASGRELVRLMEEGQSVALVSDAGMPAISDPGADLAREAIAAGIPVVPVPGANAAISALVISGLPTDRFLFVGFLPRGKKKLKDELTALQGTQATMLFYESPHRVGKTVAAMSEVWGERKAALVRELTKRHEEAVRGTLGDLAVYLNEHPPLGEYVIVVNGRESTSTLRKGLAAAGLEKGTLDGLPETCVASTYVDDEELHWQQLTIREHVDHYLAQGDERKVALKKAAADRGVSKRDIYNALLE